MTEAGSSAATVSANPTFRILVQASLQRPPDVRFFIGRVVVSRQMVWRFQMTSTASALSTQTKKNTTLLKCPPLAAIISTISPPLAQANGGAVLVPPPTQRYRDDAVRLIQAVDNEAQQRRMKRQPWMSSENAKCFDSNHS